MAESGEPECQPCAGTGKVPLIFDIAPGRMPADMEIDCPKCGGTGRQQQGAISAAERQSSLNRADGMLRVAKPPRSAQRGNLAGREMLPRDPGG
jgi:DnaJ-class molecular chaperone